MKKSRALRYLVVGGFAYVLEMTTLYVLRSFVGLSAVGSVAVSFWVGLVVAFVLQKIIAFENHDRSVVAITKQLVVYGALVAWNYAFTLVSVAVFSRHISVFAIRTVVILIVTCWNYQIYKVIFRAGQSS